jgi:hypothetical protein
MFTQETMEQYIERLNTKVTEIWEASAGAKEGETISWHPYSLTRAKKIWKDYMKFGFVRDEKGIEDMVDAFINKILTIDACTTLTGHTPENPKDTIESLELAYDEDTMEKLLNYTVDKDGTYIISDYGLKPLQILAGKILGATTPEEKLLLLDQILNVVHQRSDLAECFVYGGRATLSNLSQGD